MGRKNKIYEFLDKKHIYSEEKGLSTIVIAQELQIQRNNVSSDLNELCRQGILQKSSGRPVTYWIQQKQKTAFSELIGYKGSLKKAIEIAKASMIYPPNGLNTIISGPSGSGKSFLAEKMYYYCIEKKIIPSNAPFTVFNCADYASNPQLLLSQLFGHVKGSFTGAQSDADGIIAKSNGGVLFLDEVHRLPPEGQEMLFLFIDKGYFYKLGDSLHPVYAQERIIVATSEKPKEAMLTTFLRRFPSQIILPSLEERPIEEKIELIKTYFQMEASHLGISLLVRPQCIAALLAYHFSGNIGELKNTIRLVCAKAFLTYLSSNKVDDLIRIYITHLPKEIQIHYFSDSIDYGSLERLIPENELIFFHQIQESTSIHSLSYTTEIENTFKDYYENGLSSDEIKKLVKNDLHHFILELKSQSYTPDEEILRACMTFTKNIEEDTNLSLTQDCQEILTRFILYLQHRPFAEWEETQDKSAFLHDSLYAVISRHFLTCAHLLHLTVNEVDCLVCEYILDLFSKNQEKTTEILVVCHGESTATSITNVAIQLINYPYIYAIDMPLDHSIKQIQEEIKHHFHFEEEADVLLIIDMGSLKSLESFLEKEYRCHVYSIDMASTLIVLDACKMAKYDDLSAREIVQKLEHNYHITPSNTMEKKVIVTSCMTGEGTAERLASYLDDYLDKNNITNVEIITYGSQGSLLDLVQGKDVVAIIGTVNPHDLNVPFIGIERILFEDGEKLLNSLIFQRKGKMMEYEEGQQENLEEARQLSFQFIADNVNVQFKNLILDCVKNTLKDIESSMNIQISVNHMARFLIHYAFCVERLIENDAVTECNELHEIKTMHKDLFTLIQNSIRKNLPAYSQNLTEAEVAYITMIFI